MRHLRTPPTWPRFPEEASANEPGLPAHQTFPVLLVEHYLPLANPLRRGLEEEGIATHLARSDAEADALVWAGPYAAVVVNWKVPRAGGLALVRAWRQAGLAVPILLLAPPSEEEQALEAGADAVLPLPFSFTELLARLQEWVEATPAELGRGSATRAPS